VHAPTDKIQRELKCEYLIETKRRNPNDCEPLCPWQHVDAWSQEVFDIVMLSSTAMGKDDDMKFYFDSVRFEIAMKIYMVPQKEWRTALEWVRFCLRVANDPEEQNTE
jgi:hypothetical protein